MIHSLLLSSWGSAKCVFAQPRLSRNGSKGPCHTCHNATAQADMARLGHNEFLGWHTDRISTEQLSARCVERANAHLRSLHSFMDTAESADIAVRVWPGKYSIDDVTTPNGKTFRLINLPFYYVGMIDKILDKATG